jgi:hypothetical protein
MLLIDLKVSRKTAFASGFLKGLGAPFLLYGSFDAPALPSIDQVTLPKRKNDREALAGDWEKVGCNIRSAIEKYGKEAQSAK